MTTNEAMREEDEENMTTASMRCEAHLWFDCGIAGPDHEWMTGIEAAAWPSTEARDALLPIAIAQIGTAGTDRVKWAQRVVLGTIRRVLPLALHRAGLHAHAKACREAQDLEAARAAADDAAESAHRYAAATATAAYYAARAAFSARHATDDSTYEAVAANDAARMGAATARAAAAAIALAEPKLAHRALREAVAVAIDAYCAEGRA